MHVGAVKEPALAAAPPAATLPRGGNLETIYGSAIPGMGDDAKWWG